MSSHTLRSIIFFLLVTTIDAAANFSSHSHSVLPSFELPPASSRPKFRYWFPDASVPASAVQSDVAALAEASSGGLQFLGFYNQGFPPMSTNWSTYGFGTPAFKELLRAALKATAAHGLLFDFAVGPNTAAGVPAVPGTEGLAMELVYGARTVNVSQRIRGIPPAVLEFNHQPLNGWVHEPENWGPSELVAVTAAQVVSRGRRSGGGSRAVEQVVLRKENIVDLTESARNGSLDWTPPTVPAQQGQPALPWVVMAFYQRFSNERSCVSAAKPPSWIGNGSWMVDHFSAAGARKMTDFWDQQIFDDAEIDGLLRKVGSYSWEDSMEMMAPLWWTPNFVERFRRARGYDPIKYLPVFFQAKNLWNSYGEPYDSAYALEGEPTDGGKYAEDYRLTLTEGYQDYLLEHQRWSAARGLGHSTQPGYNMPLDMSSSIPLVAAPELESLGFGESIDNYRQFTGPAHLSGRKTISTEIGAQRGGAYAQTVPTLLGLFRDSFAAGVNTLVIHGFAYGGTYPGTTWPGYTPFQYEFCEMWGPRQPAWRHLNDTMLFAARTSEVLKSGVPRADLAFYAWKQPWTARSVYQGADLNAAGYTFEYLGPENLSSANLSVKGGVLAPDGPAYKGIVIWGQTRITPSASAALLQFARQNLSIFIVGSVPNTTIGVVGQQEVSENMARLVGFANVAILPSTGFGPEVLQETGILPRIFAESIDGAQNSSQLFTAWRSHLDSGLETVYLLNRGQASTFSVFFATSPDAVPYKLDAWTGEQKPLLAYLPTDGGISLQVTLQKSQSTIIAFKSHNATGGAQPLHVVSRSPNLSRIRLNENGQIEAYAADFSEAYVLLSDNREVAIPAITLEDTSKSTAISPITLGPWALSVESYAAPAALSPESVASNVAKITIPALISKLVPWTQIRGLERVSGVGMYRSSFATPSPPNTANLNETVSMGYTLHFSGRILNTIRVRVNGVVVPAIDPAAPSQGRDITSLLKTSGENEVVVEVTSTLFNAVKARMGDLRSVGAGVRVPRYYTQVQWAEFGLVGDVVVKRWRRVQLS